MIKIPTTAILTCIFSAGCVCTPINKPEASIVSVSTVLDMVKDELNAYQNTTPVTELQKSTCNPDGNSMTINSKEVIVTLQTVALHKSEPSAGLAAPIGVVSFDPSYSGSYSKKKTQIIVIPLTVDRSQPVQPIKSGEHPIASAIAKFRDELLKVNHNKTPCLSKSKDMTLTLSFDVVNQSTGVMALKIVPYKLGDKETIGEELHQTIQLTFELSGAALLK